MSAADTDAMTTLVNSLSSSFRTVPPAALPSMLDCILASSAISPSLMFDLLRGNFTAVTKDMANDDEKLDAEQCGHIIAYLRAFCHLIKKPGVGQTYLQSFIWKIFVPLVRMVKFYDREMLNEIVESFLELVIDTCSWDVVEETLTPFLLGSVGLSMGLHQNDDGAIIKWSRVSNSQGLESLSIELDFEVGSMGNLSGPLPLTTSCHILCSLLDASLQSVQKVGSIPAGLGFSAGKFLGNLFLDLCTMTIQMLSQSLEHRSCAVVLLLSIFKVFASECNLDVSASGEARHISRSNFLMQIWKCCKILLSLGPQERRDAYSIISLYLTSFCRVKLPEGYGNAQNLEEFDIRDQKEFWVEIKKGLVEKEGLLRKQSLYMLKKALLIHEERHEGPTITKPKACLKGSASHGMSKRDWWADKEAKSLGVGEIYSPADPCLNKRQKWDTFLLLYEMLEEYGTHLVEAAWNHQIMLLIYSPFEQDNYVNSIDAVYESQRDTLVEGFDWLAILWERGLSHDNPQVRCLIMQSFLEVEWKNQRRCAQFFSEDFVLGPFLEGLNDPAHHKDFGLKGVYSSKTICGASRFLLCYCSSLSGSNHLSFLCKLASAARQHPLGRAGLMSLSECLSSACMSSTTSSFLGDYDTKCKDVTEDRSPDCQSLKTKIELLDGLRFLVESSKQHFNPNYRLKVCQKVLEAAASVLCAFELPLEMLLLFVSAIPREFTDPGGPLRIQVQAWLVGCGKQEFIGSFSSDKKQHLKSLWDFPGVFTSQQYFLNSLGHYSDEDLDAWGLECERWARLLFLVVEEEHQLDPLVMFIKDRGFRIFQQDTPAEWIPVKFLVLILSILQELKVIHKKAEHVVKLDAMTFAGLSHMVAEFVDVFLVILDKLLAYASFSCSVFWSGVGFENTRLPGSVTGKLGGPSQRRLSSPATTAVLQAITSVKTVACILSWCSILRNDVDLNVPFTFLWDFFCKVIKSPLRNSETDAEILVGAYEALSFVLKALVSRFSSFQYSSLGIDASFDKPLLDSLVITFLNHINDFLSVGMLARARRAVLLNWKWLCLEALLSIPYHTFRNTADKGGSHTSFSDDVLRYIFGELVESLENAGEDFMVPMLRSVRMVLDLLTSDSPVVSSSRGVDVQMMWRLVHSSWILHVNCNKRRVAPIAALLSSVLHASVYGDEAMHVTNSELGPLKWFTEKILEEGIRSPRTIRLAALHLTGLWLINPRIIRYYLKELRLLTLYGSVAFDEDFEGELTENDDVKTEISLLEKSPDPEISEVFINTELYARVSVAALFDKLGTLVALMGSSNETDDCLVALESGKLFLLELLDYVVNDNDLSKELYKKYSAIHRRKIRSWQMICVLSRFVDQDIVEQVTQSLHIALYRNNLPGVRQYLESFAIHLYLVFPSLVQEQLVRIFRDYNMRTQALSSYVFIAANIILHAEEEVQARHLNELLPPIIPLLTSHHHTLRGFTQLLVYQIFAKVLPAMYSSDCGNGTLEKKCFHDLESYLSLNPDCMRLRSSMEVYLDAFNPEKSLTPAGIFTNRVEALEFECVPVSLMERVINFLNDVREELRCSMAKDEAAIKNESLRVAADPSCRDLYAEASEESLIGSSIRNTALNFQRKFTICENEMQRNCADCSLGQPEIDKGLAVGIEKEDRLLMQALHSRVASVRKLSDRQQFILVASLIDRIPNLAGLARTCEVFKAAGLALSDVNVLNDKQFQLISVTAERWVPIIEVPVDSVKTFLEKKKREGFSILGLEQTANSIPLDKYNWPKKTVLVLGREKEGIPVDIIHILDACIEIPQLGVVRSLNVHVSGAIALWEYTRQHRSK